MRAIYLILMIVCLSACKTRYVHVPVETVKTEKEYIDKWLRDSIYIQDSIIIKQASDTVFIEKYKYMYRDKFIRDSVFIVDSIKIEIPYPVEILKEVNNITKWQSLWITLGKILGGIIISIIAYIFFKVIKK